MTNRITIEINRDYAEKIVHEGPDFVRVLRDALRGVGVAWDVLAEEYGLRRLDHIKGEGENG
jgi:hypothetical protein